MMAQFFAMIANFDHHLQKSINMRQLLLEENQVTIVIANDVTGLEKLDCELVASYLSANNLRTCLVNDLLWFFFK